MKKNDDEEPRVDDTQYDRPLATASENERVPIKDENLAEFNALVEFGGDGSVAEYVSGLVQQRNDLLAVCKAAVEFAPHGETCGSTACACWQRFAVAAIRNSGGR